MNLIEPLLPFVQEYELSPIEVAIAEMTQKTRDLLAAVEREPTDVKKLQLRLQVRGCGCVPSVTRRRRLLPI